MTDQSNNSTILFPHDALFKKVFENQMVAKEFFLMHLPEEIKSMIDIENLKLEKETYIESDLTNSMSDVLFKTKFNDTDGYLYILIEHQSKTDSLMAFRLFKYMISICDRHLNLNTGSKKLPIIYPILFYQGKRKYKTSRNLWDLFCKPALAKDIWNNDYQLVDLQNIHDEELKSNMWAGVFQFFMKYIFERNLLKIWEEIGDKLPQIARVEMGYDFIKILLSYSLTKLEENDKVAIEEFVYSKLREKKKGSTMVSIAQSWRNEGKAEGKAEGISEIAIKMLEGGIDIEFIAKVTGYSISQIKELQKKISKVK
jgi:predicted transposase/invertase (TIGR01784 family)